jgi:hypothetical protein
MVLSMEGFQIEIRGDNFVCIDDGARTNFCEWKYLDPLIQDRFKAIKSEILVVLENFITSDEKSIFDSAAERYPTQKE